MQAQLVEDRPEIILSEGDERSLRDLLQQVPRGALRDFLEDELDRAMVLPSVPDRGIVGMHSRVLFEDMETGERRSVQLTYPGQANIQEGKISVLTPVGVALLGLSVGQAIAWAMPDGRSRRLRIVRIEENRFHSSVQ